MSVWFGVSRVFPRSRKVNTGVEHVHRSHSIALVVLGERMASGKEPMEPMAMTLPALTRGKFADRVRKGG